MYQNLSVNDFFDLVLFEEVGELEIHNYIESITNGFQVGRLRLLLKDLEFRLFCVREEKLSEYSPADIELAIKARLERGSEIPYKNFPRMELKNGKIIEEHKLLNYEALLFPYYFYTVYRMIGEIKVEIKKNESNQSPSSTQKFKIKSTLIALFCWVVNDSDLIKREEEGVEKYCRRICNEFGLEYTERVRQNFNVRSTPKKITELREQILPKIEPSLSKKIIDYLDRKYPPKQKLYA